MVIGNLSVVGMPAGIADDDRSIFHVDGIDFSLMEVGVGQESPSGFTMWGGSMLPDTISASIGWDRKMLSLLTRDNSIWPRRAAFCRFRAV